MSNMILSNYGLHSLISSSPTQLCRGEEKREGGKERGEGGGREEREGREKMKERREREGKRDEESHMSLFFQAWCGLFT